jgi:diguanylate cyclase (GGDEF)-like protein
VLQIEGRPFFQLEKQIGFAQRSERSLTVAFIDLDGLKIINDNQGHDAGDKFIKTFTEVLNTHLRKYDIIARIGGDEFLIIFPECTLKRAKDIVERIKEELISKEMSFKYDFSFGFSEYNAGNKMDVDKMVKIADNAMYQQKIMKKYKKKGIEFE